VVALYGEHDMSTTLAVEAVLDAILAKGTNVVIDSSQALFIEGSILRATMLGHRALTPTRIVAVAAPPETQHSP
jgi:hypothetical protein